MVIETLTGILVVVTAIYAFFTLRILNANNNAVKAMNRQSEAFTRPYLTVAPFIPPRTHMIFLRISNTGRTSAEKLQLHMDRDFYQYGDGNDSDRNLARMNAFSQPIETFPPGAELIFGLVPGPVLFGEAYNPAVTPTTFVVSASYSHAGKLFSESTTVDLSAYRASMSPPDPMIDQLEGIRKALERAGSG